MNCLWHELCLTARWLQFNSWSRRNTGEKSWQSQFMMSCLQSEQHQFIHKKRARTNGILSIISLLLFYEFFNLPLGNITRNQRERISLRRKPFQIIRGIPFVRPRRISLFALANTSLSQDNIICDFRSKHHFALARISLRLCNNTRHPFRVPAGTYHCLH